MTCDVGSGMRCFSLAKLVKEDNGPLSVPAPQAGLDPPLSPQP